MKLIYAILYVPMYPRRTRMLGGRWLFFLFQRYYFLFIFYSVVRLSFQTVIIAPGRMLGGIFRKPQFLNIVQSGRIKNKIKINM